MDVLVSREAGCRERPPDRDGEDLAELMDAVFDPLSPMLKRTPSLAVRSAQPGATNAAQYAVVGTRRFGRNEDGAG